MIEDQSIVAELLEENFLDLTLVSSLKILLIAGNNIFFISVSSWIASSFELGKCK